MRIWSLHPQYLDTKGLVALWRETLLAKHVLEGKTKGYRNHPQLIRFKCLDNPVQAINQYLTEVYKEAEKRGYRFDRNKIDGHFTSQILPVTKGQLAYEAVHLLNKLSQRDPERYLLYKRLKVLATHPMFRVEKGEIEHWEIIR